MRDSYPDTEERDITSTETGVITPGGGTGGIEGWN